MKIGLLWFDNDPHADMPTKFQRFTDYYQKRYGSMPNLVYMHPAQVGSWESINNIEIRPNRSILPNHFWVGIKDTEQ